MTNKKPLVYGSDGRIQQLQSGDTLQVPTSEVSIFTLTNANAGSITQCQAVYITSNDHVDLAKASALGTEKVYGLVFYASISSSASGSIQTGNVATATTTVWQAVTDGGGGLTEGVLYFLSDTTAGNITSTVPSTTGHYSCPVGFAISTTELELHINPYSNILL